MNTRLFAILIIAALFFCVTGVMADDSGEGSDDSSDNSNDDSSDDSSDDSMDDSTDDSIDTSPTRDDSADDSRADRVDDSAGERVDDSMENGVDNSADDGMKSAVDDSPDSAEQEMEIEIEHGIAAIITDESKGLSTGSEAQPAVLTRSLVSLSSLPGTGPARMATLAKTVDDSYDHFSEAERSIQNRNGIVTFFFGGDDSAADDILEHVSGDSSALDEMERMMNDPSASPALKTFTQARLRIIRAELQRMETLAATEKAKQGLLG